MAYDAQQSYQDRANAITQMGVDINQVRRDQIQVCYVLSKDFGIATYFGGFFSDLQVGKHSTTQSWLGSTK